MSSRHVSLLSSALCTATLERVLGTACTTLSGGTSYLWGLRNRYHAMLWPIVWCVHQECLRMLLHIKYEYNYMERFESIYLHMYIYIYIYILILLVKACSGTLRKLRNKTIIILVETKLIILLNMEPRSTLIFSDIYVYIYREILWHYSVIAWLLFKKHLLYI